MGTNTEIEETGNLKNKIKCPNCLSSKVIEVTLNRYPANISIYYKCDKCEQAFERVYYYQHTIVIDARWK